MKRFICALLVVMMIFSLCACKGEKAKSDINIEETTESSAYPVPKEKRFEESENNLHARFTFTLEEFTSLLNDECKALGTSDVETFFDYDNWELISENLIDDNGIAYSSYYYATDTLSITAAVENESGKVMNIGCGTTYTEFVNADENYQYTVILTSAIIAMVAGGYEKDDLEFLYCIFFDSAKNNEKFYYENGVYMMNLSKAEGEEGSVVLFMTSPCSEDIISTWELTDYNDYDGSAKDL